LEFLFFNDDSHPKISVGHLQQQQQQETKSSQERQQHHGFSSIDYSSPILLSNLSDGTKNDDDYHHHHHHHDHHHHENCCNSMNIDENQNCTSTQNGEAEIIFRTSESCNTIITTNTTTTTTTDVSGSSCSSKDLVFHYDGGIEDSGKKRKRKRRKKVRNKNGLLCTHCSASKSSEWRKGPLGRRTLCNACGLKYSRVLSIQTERSSINTNIEFILNPEPPHCSRTD